MAEIEQNESYWGRGYEWPQQGDEWSEDWGNPRNQWWGTIFPRIHPFLPTGTVLEIAPGFGRWTQFLKTLCERLIIVDLNENCIDSCKKRFSDSSNIEYHKNDGKSLEMVSDNSVDFVFSYDSLVHVDLDVIHDYLAQLAQKLTSNGVGFIHHSNVESYLRGVKQLPNAIARHLDWRVNDRVNGHWRSTRVSAERFNEVAASLGLSCVSQECINWRGKYLIDCMSTFTRKRSIWDRPREVMDNKLFMVEAHRLKRLTPEIRRGETPASVG